MPRSEDTWKKRERPNGGEDAKQARRRIERDADSDDDGFGFRPQQPDEDASDRSNGVYIIPGRATLPRAVPLPPLVGLAQPALVAVASLEDLATVRLVHVNKAAPNLELVLEEGQCTDPSNKTTWDPSRGSGYLGSGWYVRVFERPGVRVAAAFAAHSTPLSLTEKELQETAAQLGWMVEVRPGGRMLLVRDQNAAGALQAAAGALFSYVRAAAPSKVSERGARNALAACGLEVLEPALQAARSKYAALPLVRGCLKPQPLTVLLDMIGFAGVLNVGLNNDLSFGSVVWNAAGTELIADPAGHFARYADRYTPDAVGLRPQGTGTGTVRSSGGGVPRRSMRRAATRRTHRSRKTR